MNAILRDSPPEKMRSSDGQLRHEILGGQPEVCGRWVDFLTLLSGTQSFFPPSAFYLHHQRWSTDLDE